MKLIQTIQNSGLKINSYYINFLNKSSESENDSSSEEEEQNAFERNDENHSDLRL